MTYQKRRETIGAYQSGRVGARQMKRYLRNEISHDEWLALRRGNINASEAAIVCGEGPWGSPAILFAEKMGRRPPLSDSAAFRKGRWGEPAVFEALAEKFPEWETHRAAVYVVDEEKRQGSTPDGFARAPDRPGIGAVQAKTCSRTVFRRKWLLDPDDDVEFGEAMLPAEYTIQALQDARLNDCQWAVVPVLILGEYDWTFRMFEVEPSDELAARIDFHVAEYFEKYLDPGIMPPFEPQRDEQLIRQLYPRDAGTTIDLSGDNRAMQLVTDLGEVKAGIKRLETTEREIETELKGKLQENTFGLLADGRCLSWKTHNRKGYTVAPTTYRQLRVLKSAPQEEDDE